MTEEICPIMTTPTAIAECWGDVCNWYDYEAGRCAVLTIALNLSEIERNQEGR